MMALYGMFTLPNDWMTQIGTTTATTIGDLFPFFAWVAGIMVAVMVLIALIRGLR